VASRLLGVLALYVPAAGVVGWLPNEASAAGPTPIGGAGRSAHRAMADHLGPGERYERCPSRRIAGTQSPRTALRAACATLTLLRDHQADSQRLHCPRRGVGPSHAGTIPRPTTYTLAICRVGDRHLPRAQPRTGTPGRSAKAALSVETTSLSRAAAVAAMMRS
jgi:hypothetical protein